jgi:hypothetical protein
MVRFAGSVILLRIHGVKDEAEGAAAAGGGRVPIGPMDGERVVGEEVAREGWHHLFLRVVLFCSKIGHALRKSQRAGGSVGTEALEMGATHVAHTAIFFINLLESHPHREGVGRIEFEVVSVLVRRGGLADAGRLVKELHVFCGDLGAQEVFCKSAWLPVHEFREPRIILVERLQLLERGRVVPVLVEDMFGGKVGNDVSDESFQFLMTGCDFAGVEEAGDGYKAVFLKLLARAHGIMLEANERAG